MMTRRLSTLLILGLGLTALPGCSWFDSWDGKQTSLDGERRIANATVDPSPEGLYGAGVEALQASYLDQGVTFDIGGEDTCLPGRV